MKATTKKKLSKAAKKLLIVQAILVGFIVEANYVMAKADTIIEWAKDLWPL